MHLGGGDRAAWLPIGTGTFIMTNLSGFETMSGDEWQDLCVRVLHEHYPGAELVEVPDDDRGDAGLEAFTLNGCVYQCYAPENEPLSTSIRYNKQRDKMTADVGKFIKNADKIKKILPSGLLVDRWVLLVPLINSRRLLEHAKKKTDEVRAASLSYVSSDFVVVSQTLDAFGSARESVVNRQLKKLHLPPVDDVDFSDLDDELVSKMRSKLAMTVVYADDDKRRGATNRFLKSYISGRTHRDFVQDQYSELGYQLEEELSDLEDRLSVQYALDEPVPDRRLSRVLADTEQAVADVLKSHTRQNRVIAEGQVADWLMRCPLGFL